MRVLVAAAVSLLALGAAACSEGEPIEAPEPTSEPTAAPVAEVAPPEPEPPALPDPVVVPIEAPEPTSEPTAAPVAEVAPPEPEPPALPDPVVVPIEAPEPTSEIQGPRVPLVWWLGGFEVERQTLLEEFAGFPDDVALVYHDGLRCSTDGCGVMRPLYRLYKRDGQLFREELLADDHPYVEYVIAIPDGSRMVGFTCHRAICIPHSMGLGGYDPDAAPLPTTDLYESLDGGVSWQHLDTLELPWRVAAITADTLQLISLNFGPPSAAHMFWPSMELDVWAEGDGRTWGEFWAMKPKRAEIEGHDRDTIFVDLIGELPTVPGPFGQDYTVLPVAVQLGPFLRVADDVNGCLPMLADPSPDAAELACASARVLLQDQGEAVELAGTTWHSVRTPAGITGWADGRSLD